LLFAQADLDHDPPIYASCHSRDDRHVPPRPAIGRDWVSRSCCPGLAKTTVLPIAASPVARIAGMSHRWPAIFNFLGTSILFSIEATSFFLHSHQQCTRVPIFFISSPASVITCLWYWPS
jgi:hypothetical protein